MRTDLASVTRAPSKISTQPRRKVLELAATILPTAWLALDLAYTHLDAIDAETGAPLQRRPEHTASARVTLRPTDKARLAASVLYVGERFNNADRQNLLDAYIRVDLTGSYALYENTEASHSGRDPHRRALRGDPGFRRCRPLRLCGFARTFLLKQDQLR